MEAEEAWVGGAAGLVSLGGLGAGVGQPWRNVGTNRQTGGGGGGRLASFYSF